MPTAVPETVAVKVVDKGALPEPGETVRATESVLPPGGTEGVGVSVPVGVGVGQLFVPIALRVVPQLLVWVKLTPEQTVEGSGDQEVGTQGTEQSLVPVAPRVVPQLLVWVKLTPEQTVEGSGDQEETVQQYLVPQQVPPQPSL